MRLAFFQPNIPQNLGAAIRLGACLGAAIEIIEPCAFPLSEAGLKRAAMDYRDMAEIVRRPTFADFLAAPERGEGRLVLFTTKAEQAYHAFAFRPGDTLLFGEESAGAPAEVHAAADARLVVPMRAGARSLNLVVTAAIALAEALRQTAGFPSASLAG